MTDTSGWRPIETAPRNDQPVLLLLASGYELPAVWMQGFENEQGECGAWCAWSKNMIPPSWSDAVCWAVNEAGTPSDPPIAWLPYTEAARDA